MQKATGVAGDVADIDIEPEGLPDAFVQAMDDDLNLASAMAVIHEWVKRGNKAIADCNVDLVRECLTMVRSMLDILGLDPFSSVWVKYADSAQGDNKYAQALDVLVKHVLSDRQIARADKNWVKADALRDLLTDAGIIVEDGASGASWHM